MEMVRQIASLVLVFSLLGFVLWKVKALRPGLRKSGRALQSIERLTLSPQHTLHLLRVNGRDLLLATHPHGCTALDLPEASETVKVLGAGA
jgi:flagellar biogenesis protein FliO